MPFPYFSGFVRGLFLGFIPMFFLVWMIVSIIHRKRCKSKQNNATGRKTK